MATTEGIYTFVLYTTREKSYKKEHFCKSLSEAQTEAKGMWYALRCLYKHPRIYIYSKDGRMVDRKY